MFNPKSEADVKLATDYINTIIGDWYSSSMYSNGKARYEKRRNAYYCRPDTAVPVWKSKLYLATYFLGCKVIEAQLRKSRGEGGDFALVGLQPGKDNTPEAIEKRKIANYDLNNDLQISRFTDTLDKMEWFMVQCGWAVGREYIISDVVESNRREVVEGRFGGQSQINEVNGIEMIEHTKTDVIHPLNWGHSAYCSDFPESRNSFCRFRLSVVELYKMLQDEEAYLPGVKRILDDMNKNGIPKILNDSNIFYFDDYFDGNVTQENSIVVDECMGDLNYKGNYDDNNLYYVLIHRSTREILRISRSPFKSKNLWKIRAYPDGATPYGVGPCDQLLAPAQLDNNIINQYIDWCNANMKFLYQTYDGYIAGGLAALIDSPPGGVVVADTADAWKQTGGELIKPLRKDAMGLPGVSDILGFSKEYKANASPMGNYHGQGVKDAGGKQTATAVGLMSSREDSFMECVQSNVDSGINQALHIKLENRHAFMSQENAAQPTPDSPVVRYFPWELGGIDYTTTVKRSPGDVQSQKTFQFLNICKSFFELGIINPAGMQTALKNIGKQQQIPEVEDMFKEMAPEIGMGAPAMPGVPAAQPRAPINAPQQAQAPAVPPPQPGVIANAMAA